MKRSVIIQGIITLILVFAGVMNKVFYSEELSSILLVLSAISSCIFLILLIVFLAKLRSS